MKNANVGSKKAFKTSESRRTAGMQVRSGVKAGGVSRKGAGMSHSERGLTRRGGSLTSW